MATLTVGFGDTVQLKSGDIGTVRFIGYTEFKQDTVFYGIHLKEKKGKHNGIHLKDNKKYFKCPKGFGLFIEKNKIIQVVKKHSVSTSFHFNQNVYCVNNNNNIGKGKLLFIGLTKYDNYNNYFYGVELNKTLR